MDAFAWNKSRKPRRVSLASAFAINCTASADDAILKELIRSVFEPAEGPKHGWCFPEKKFWRTSAPRRNVSPPYWYIPSPRRSRRFIFAFFVILVKSIRSTHGEEMIRGCRRGGCCAWPRSTWQAARRRETPSSIPKEAVGVVVGSRFSRPAVSIAAFIHGRASVFNLSPG